jgi:hypothetical protein
MRTTSNILLVGALAAALVLTGCGSDSSAEEDTGATTLGVRSTQITVAAAGATPGPGTDGQTLANGDTITTDGTGFGLINYPDSSVTRIDKNAIFTLDDVGTSATQPQVKATLKQGQAWNRVQRITDTNTGQYEITTPYGTVAVRGTTFNIDCTQPAGGCTITVIEGTIEYTPTTGTPVTLAAPTQVAVTATGAGTPGPIPGSFTTSDWTATNTELDQALASNSGDQAAPTNTVAAGAGSADSIDLAAYDACTLTTEADLNTLGIGPQTAAQTAPADEGAAACIRGGSRTIDIERGRGKEFLSVAVTRAPEIVASVDSGETPDGCAPVDGPPLGEDALWLTCTFGNYGESGATVRLGDTAVIVLVRAETTQITPAFISIVERVVAQVQNGG